MDPIVLRTARLRLASVIHRYLQVHFANSAVLTSFSIGDLRELVSHRPLPGYEYRGLPPPPIPADGEWTIEMQIREDLHLAIFNLTYIDMEIAYAKDPNDDRDINDKIMAMYKAGRGRFYTSSKMFTAPSGSSGASADKDPHHDYKLNGGLFGGEDDAPKEESIFHKVAREVLEAFNKDRAERAARAAEKAVEADKADKAT